MPKLDDQRCGYETCGEFARAVAEGKAPCYGCVSGGPEVAAKVCEIMGARVPEQAIPQFGHSPGFYLPGLSGGRGMGTGIGRGLGRGRGMWVVMVAEAEVSAVVDVEDKKEERNSRLLNRRDV